MNANRRNPAAEVLRRLAESATGKEILPHASIVGRWVWAVFPAKPSEEIRTLLKAEGFEWNRVRTRKEQRSVWQHSGGIPSRRADYDPRTRYGEIPAEEVLA